MTEKRNELMQAQKKYCKDRNIPEFAPTRTGYCYKCKQDIVDETWATEHITGCSKCCWSFCE